MAERLIELLEGIVHDTGQREFRTRRCNTDGVLVEEEKLTVGHPQAHTILHYEKISRCAGAGVDKFLTLMVEANLQDSLEVMMAKHEGVVEDACVSGTVSYDTEGEPKSGSLKVTSRSGEPEGIGSVGWRFDISGSELDYIVRGMFGDLLVNRVNFSREVERVDGSLRFGVEIVDEGEGSEVRILEFPERMNADMVADVIEERRMSGLVQG